MEQMHTVIRKVKGVPRVGALFRHVAPQKLAHPAILAALMKHPAPHAT